jgi:predicted nucleic acid-binding protein
MLDSNAIIYAAKPEHGELRKFIADFEPMVPSLCEVEVLGYHKLSDSVKALFESFFRSADIAHVTKDVIDRAVSLRQQRKMSLGDAVIAATALVHSRKLITHNTSDYDWIPDLELIDPLNLPKA